MRISSYFIDGLYVSGDVLGGQRDPVLHCRTTRSWPWAPASLSFSPLKEGHVYTLRLRWTHYRPLFSQRITLHFTLTHTHVQYTNAHTHTHTHAQTHTRPRTHTHIHTHTHTHTHIQAHTHVHTLKHTNTRSRTHTDTLTHAHTHVQTQTHTLTHSRTHTHVLTAFEPSNLAGLPTYSP